MNLRRVSGLRRALVLPAAAALAVGVLAGCSGDDGDNGDAGSDDSSQSDDASSEDASDDSSDDSSEDDTDTGDTGDTDGDIPDVDFDGDLPEGFPVDEVPLIDGDIAFGTQAGGAYSVTVESDESDLDDVYDEVAEDLSDAGFDEGAKQELGEVIAGNFENDDWIVGIAVVTDAVSDGSVVTYSVTRAS